MSMIGSYVRLTDAELQSLLNNPENLGPFLYPAEHSSDDPQRRDIDKTWQLIHYLLNGDAWTGTGPLAAAVLGGVPLSDEDFGYGPARYLKPAEVAATDAALRQVSAQELWSRFDVEAVAAAEIYPDWEGSEEDCEYISQYFDALKDFFAVAAANRQAMILWIT